MDKLINRLTKSLLDHKNSSLYEQWVRMGLKHAYRMGKYTGRLEVYKEINEN